MSSPFDFDPHLVDQRAVKMIQELAEAARLAQPSPEALKVFQQQTKLAEQAYLLAEPYKQLELLNGVAATVIEMNRFAQVLRSFLIPPINAYLDQLQPHLEREPDEQEVLVESEVSLILPATRLRIVRFSPSFPILEKILRGDIDLDGLHWREFEELVADLLSKDGYYVELGRGTKDDGIDILALKDMEGIGPVMSVWQAKKYNIKNPIGIEVIRELITTRDDFKASKGVIVTTTYLTGPAITRVQRDKYQLAKIDRNDLINWIRKAKQR